MSKSNLKPRHKHLIESLDHYRFAQAVQMSDLEFQVLSSVCIDAERAIRIVSKTAIKSVPSHLKCNLLPHLTTDSSPIPMATMVGNNEAFRISIPISFIHRLLAVAPTRGGLLPTQESDYFCQSVMVAVLAAYAHELSHIFTGHLSTKSSIAQESNADYTGGGLTWHWLRRVDIQKLCRLEARPLEPACAYGFLHLLSILNDADHDESIYLPRAGRLLVYGGAAAFAADKKLGAVHGDLMEKAMKSLPRCPDINYQSVQIEAAHEDFLSKTTESLKDATVSALGEIPFEKRHWYNASVHLKSIKKELQRMLKKYSKGRS